MLEFESEDELHKQINETSDEGAALARRCVSGAIQKDTYAIAYQVIQEDWKVLASALLFQSYLVAGLLQGMYPDNTEEEWSDFLVELEKEMLDD